MAAVLGVLVTPVQGAMSRGVQALMDTGRLPCLENDVSVHQVSSYDRAGGNNDRNVWLYQDDRDDYVIFDESGAGCIYRFWMTHGGAHPDYKNHYATNSIKIYIDDDVEPRFECSIADLFSGLNPSFPAPLAGNASVSSGGLYSYVPIPYRSRCRITVTDIPPSSMRELPWGVDSYWMYYAITYHRYATDENMVSWTGAEDLSGLISLLSSTYEDPDEGGSGTSVNGSADLAAEADVELLNYVGTGVVHSILLDKGAISPEQMTNLWLKIFWDDETTAAVYAPLGEFFGTGYRTNSLVGAQLMGRKPEGDFYCYFPMPFWGGFRLVIENKDVSDAGSLAFSIRIGDRVYDPDLSGHFHAEHRRQSYTNGITGSDFICLDETGRGRVVGMSLYGRGAGKIYGNGLSFLEGDERIYIDGGRSPRIHGTGMEDYFNGGWYFSQGAFSLPYHGSPVRSPAYGMNVETNYVGAYRLHVGDAIPFNQSIRIGMEHGGENEVGCTFSSVVYYYKLDGAESGLIEAAQLDVGHLQAETDYHYTFDGASMVVTNLFAYPGDDHDIAVSDDGRQGAAATSFSVPVPDTNAGLLLRRRIDAGVPFQAAVVSVDGDPVGDWIFHDESYMNVAQRWFDDDFFIPFGYTAGKSNIVLTFESQPGADPWTEYAYSVFAVKPLVESSDADDDGMADRWEVAYFGNILNALDEVDADGDGFMNRDEYICLTDPLDGDSYFHLFSSTDGEQERYFDTDASRTYRVMCSTNLLQGDWEVVETVTGDGRRVMIPGLEDGDQTVFYRVGVELK